MTDLESIRQQMTTRLPRRMQWLIGDTPWDFDFSRAQAPLAPISSDDLSGTIEESWRLLYVFGEEDLAEGGGASPYLCVHRDTGEILGLDVERSGAQVFLLNTDTDKFIRTVLRLDAVLRLRTPAPHGLSDVLREIDPDAFSHSDWQGLCDHIGQ